MLSLASAPAPELRSHVVNGLTFPAQRLSAEVLGSSHVQQALALLAAHDAGNFVRFFQLMRGMPYLMVCIAHRLVPAMRHRALRIWVNGEHRAREDVLGSQCACWSNQ